MPKLEVPTTLIGRGRRHAIGAHALSIKMLKLAKELVLKPPSTTLMSLESLASGQELCQTASTKTFGTTTCA